MSKIKLGIALFFLVLIALSFQGIVSSGLCQEAVKTVYACSSCGVEQSGEGKCPTCGAPLAKTEVTYECPTCGMVQVKSGNCSMCGSQLLEKRVPAR